MEQPLHKTDSNGVVEAASSIQTAGSVGTGSGATLELDSLLGRVLRNWYLLVIGIVLASSIAYFYLRYAEVRYQVESTILVREDSESNSVESLIAGLGNPEATTEIANELKMIKSRGIMLKTVTKLGLDVAYFSRGRIKNDELYRDERCPVRVTTYAIEGNGFGKLFEVTLDSVGYRVEYEDKLDTNCEFGEACITPFGSFILERDTSSLANGNTRNPILIRFSRFENIAHRYINRLSVGQVKGADLIEISLIDPVPEKAVDIISGVVSTYNEETIEDKNRTATRTLEFVGERLDSLNQELSKIEQRAEVFILQNDIIGGVSSDFRLKMEELAQKVASLEEIERRQRMVADVERYLQDERKSNELIPYSLSLENLDLGELINQYNELVLRREALQNTASSENPATQALLKRFIPIKASILEAITETRSELQAEQARLQTGIDNINRSVRTLPGKERGLLEIAREQKIKEELYLILLQKKEETAIARAVTSSNLRVIEEPYYNDPVYPKRRQTYLLALVTGLMIPVGFLTLREFLDNTVRSVEQIRKGTTVPYLGSIAYARSRDTVVVNRSSRSAVAEMFRLVRTNLSFLGAGERTPQIFMVTSSVTGEGKSFTTINLGMALALTGKRVVLVGLDMRKPKLVRYLTDESGSVGISNYLADTATSEDIVFPAQVSDCLFYIPAGPIPPNPAELIMSDRLGQLMSELRERFDYILIDVPPVSVVTDAFLINNYTDVTLYMVRFAQTKRRHLQLIQSLYEDNKLKKPAIIFNGVRMGTGYGYNYDYGYSSAYGGGYYEEENSGKKKWYQFQSK